MNAEPRRKQIPQVNRASRRDSLDGVPRDLVSKRIEKYDRAAAPWPCRAEVGELLVRFRVADFNSITKLRILSLQRFQFSDIRFFPVHEDVLAELSSELQSSDGRPFNKR